MLKNYLPEPIYNGLKVEEWDRAIVETGINVGAVQNTVIQIIQSDEREVRRIAAFLLFSRYIKNFIRDSCELATADAIGRIENAEKRNWVSAEASRMLEYRRFIDTIEPIHVKAIEAVVHNFGEALQDPARRIELPGRPDIGFDRRVLFQLCTPETAPFIEVALETIAHDIREPRSVPEFNFLHDIVFNKIKELADNPVIKTVQKNLSDVDYNNINITALASNVIEQRRNPSKRSGIVEELLSVMQIGMEAIASTFQSDLVNRDLIIKSIMIVFNPIVKTIAETSAADNVIYSYYYKLLCCDDIMELGLENWLKIRDDLVQSSPLFRRFYDLASEKVSILLSCTETLRLINEEDRFVDEDDDDRIDED